MTTSLIHQGVTIPIKVRKEYRRNIRYSITGKSINVLIPKGIINHSVDKILDEVKDWARVEFEKKPELLNRFRVIVYQNGEFIRVFGKDFKLLIFPESRKGLSGKVIDQQYIELRVPAGADEHLLHKAIGQLLSRVLSDYFHKDIVARVQYYNQSYFQEKIESIRLKNNQSNWGSCSSKKNINLSSRLLFAPTDVLDYVIVHELAHLKEMNHSARFWKIVRDVMPDYEDKELWLKKYGHTLKF
jgi:predicted metal-dependent hydrolase